MTAPVESEVEPSAVTEDVASPPEPEAGGPAAPSGLPAGPSGLVAGGLALVCLALGVGSLFGPEPLWWAGAGLMAVALVLGHAAVGRPVRAWWGRMSEPRTVRGRTVRPATLIVDALCVVALIVVATIMMRDVWLGDRPVSHDHTVHYFKAWQTLQTLGQDGTLHGWSHLWFGGYPANYLYPVGADLWVIGVYLLGLGLFTFSQAYAIGFWLFWCLSGYAVFQLGRRGFDRWVGLAAGLLYLTDTGGFRYGGYDFAVNWGVWPQNLAVAFAALAFSRVPAMVRGGDTRDVAWFALFSGLGIISHPTILFFLLVSFAVALGVMAVSKERARFGAFGWRLAAGSAVGALIGAFWLLPFMASTDYSTRYGRWWKTYYELGGGLFEGHTFNGSWEWVLVLGALGSILLLARKEFVPRVTAVITLVLLSCGSASFIDELHLTRLSASLRFMQFERFAILLKPFWFVAVGYLVVLLARQVVTRGGEVLGEGEAGDRARQLGRRVVVAFVVALLGVPLLVPFAIEWGTTQIKHRTQVASQRSGRSDRAALVEWASTHMERDRFYRVAIFTSAHEHDLVDLTTELGLPTYKAGFTPSSSFIHKMESRSPALLQALNVRYIIATESVRGADFALLERFGGLSVYAFQGWKPEPFEVVEGAGEVRLVSFEREAIELVAAPGASGRLRLNVSEFSRWHATRDGQPVEITPLPLFGVDGTGFMSVPLAPGTYRFEFRRSGVDVASRVLLVLGLLLVGGVFVVRVGPLRKRVSLEDLSARLDGWLDARAPLASKLQWPAAVAVVVGGCAVVVGLGLWTPAMQYEADSTVRVARVRYDLLERLDDASAAVVRKNGSRKKCLRSAHRLLCDRAWWYHVASQPEPIEMYSTRRCISAHPHQGADLEIVWPAVPRGEALIGYYGVAQSGWRADHPPVRLEIEVDGKVIHDASTTGDAVTEWYNVAMPEGQGPASVVFRVSAATVDSRHFCVYGQVVDLEP